MKELGRIGQRRYAGIFQEEFLPELRGKRGIETFREMADNDSMVGAVLYAVEALIKQATWRVQAPSESAPDVECAQFLESCLYDMSQTWPDTLSEILSFLTYGWSFHEIVYKRRMGTTGRPETNSVYSDGLIGLRKLAIRSQETLYQWEYDGEDNLIGMTQLPPPDFGLRTIPFEKAVLFRTKSRKNNPEGRSILRSAYRDWYFKKRIQEIEGIGIERDLAGLPVLTAPTGADVWSDDEDMQATYARASDIVSAIRRDEIDGVVLPGPPDETRAGWKLELLASTGKRSFDTSQVIERYDNRIAMSMMADFILLGHQAVGSFALSDNKTELFAVALGSYLDIICEAINTQVFPKLIGLNAEHFKGITEVPELVHGDIENADLDKIGTFIERTIRVGAINSDDDLEDYLREISGLPKHSDRQTYNETLASQQQVDDRYDRQEDDDPETENGDRRISHHGEDASHRNDENDGREVDPDELDPDEQEGKKTRKEDGR